MAQQKARSPRVLLRGQDVGGITKTDIERRARELALIRDGSETYSQEDIQASERELFGEASPPSVAEDAASKVILSRDPADPPDIGEPQPISTALVEDEENEAPERLALQGVEEAQHDLMVRSQREKQNLPPEDRR